jgi:Tfp pilus assembly protein PilO
MTMHVIDDETRRFGRLLHYAGLLITVLCAALGYSLLHAPTRQSIANTQLRTEEVLLSVQNAPIIREHHRKVSETLDDVTARIADVQRRVPSHADAGAFLKEVTHIANAQQLAIKDFQPGNPTNQNGYAEMNVTLKGQGSFASICTFLDRLSKLKRLSKVKDLTLSATDHTTDYPMTATLIIYFSLQGKGTNPAQEDRRG